MRRISPENEMFDRVVAAASVLALTFPLEKVNDVTFTNAAACLVIAGNYEKVPEVCLAGIKKFPQNIELPAKTKDTANTI